MAVKDLVNGYEARYSPTAAPSANNSRRRSEIGQSMALSPMGARFLQHHTQSPPSVPITQVSDASGSTTTSPSIRTSMTDTTLHEPTDDKDNDNDTTQDITEFHCTTQDTTKRKHKFNTKYQYNQAEDDEETETLISREHSSAYPSVRYTKSEFSTHTGKLDKLGPSFALPISSHSHHAHHSSALHEPVPAKHVFSRAAPPLSLPKLDNYLSSLPPPLFRTFLPRQGARDDKGCMFPPMDRLQGQKLDDLERNRLVLPWWDRKTIFGGLSTAILGITGSSAVAMYYSLQGLMNTLQIFALVVNTIVPLGNNDTSQRWRELFLGTIPNILALNFHFTLIQSLTTLLLFLSISFLLLFFFIRKTRNCNRYNTVEGLQPITEKPSNWSLLLITFFLTALYLPLSTLAMHVLVWSDDLWVVKNPWANTNSTVDPVFIVQGPSSEYRGANEFCWTTTMKRNEVNWAPVFITVAALSFILLTLGFPILLRRAILSSVPRVPAYTSLGRPRSTAALDLEYTRLLDTDRNPLVFLYKPFSRRWPSFISWFLIAKLSALFIVSLIDPNNCLFVHFLQRGRTIEETLHARHEVTVVRQGLLFGLMVVFLGVQMVYAPFLDPVGNAGEWVSRANYVAMSGIALGVALEVKGKEVLDGVLLYVVYVATYGLTAYFTLISTGVGRRLVKRIARRIDFSIDIFSPRLSLAIHIRRRIWQESITTLFLTDQGACAIPKGQKMAYDEARDGEYPPYLLQFEGTPGERHVENLRILRDVGSLAYKKAVRLTTGPDYMIFKDLADEITACHLGPDSYWEARDNQVEGCTRFWGNAWWIPFPPTLVIRYDDGHSAHLRHVPEFREYVKQNSRPDIVAKKNVRMALRALDGKIVRWPYEHINPIGSHSSWWCCGSGYNARSVKSFTSCRLRIHRRGYLIWDGIPLGSGFSLELEYNKSVKVSGDVIGLTEDFDITPILARFLQLNRHAISSNLPAIEVALQGYRRHMREEHGRKVSVLSYRFLDRVYETPREPVGLAESSIEGEADVRVRALMVGSERVFETAYERLREVERSEARAWWYIFWDDVWRRNHKAIKGMELHSADFNPHYPTSIAYTPLPRAALEQFLIQRGVMSSKPSRWDFFYHGFLNKLYIRLNDCVFDGRSGKAIWFHMGDPEYGLDMDGVDSLAQAQRPSDRDQQQSIIGTGGGTDHDAESINPRQAYLWEGLLTDSAFIGPSSKKPWFRPLANMGAWFGVTPLVRTGIPSKGVSLDVKLSDDKRSGRRRYVLIDDEDSSSGYGDG